MTMKKKILTTLSVVLILGLAALGILAYLQSEDSDVNVMTLGNVSIDQIEKEWNEEQTELQDFTQDKPLYPYVGTLGWANTDKDGGAYRTFTMNNVVDKYVSVKNTGESPAYVRTFIALEMGSFDYEEFNKVGISNNKYNGVEFQFEGAWDWNYDGVMEIEGKKYNVMVAVHKDPVAAGETTIPSLNQVYLSKDATNEDVEKLDGNGNGTYDILALSQAVQVEGFSDANAALNTAFGNPAEGYNPWDGKNIEWPSDAPEEYEVVRIYDLEDFTEFGKAVNNNTQYGDVNVANNNKVWVELMADIDMTNAPAIQGDQFAIGNGNNLVFTGVFDGNNHTISNYSIVGSWTYNVSLFRTVSGNFTMKDITFNDCSASKTNNRVSSILVGTIGGGTITFDNVDINNSVSNGVAGAGAYVGNMTEGALYFINCDVNNVTLTASSETGYNAMFIRDGYSHHDYEASGVWIQNCTIKNSKSIVNGVAEDTVKEYNYTK